MASVIYADQSVEECNTPDARDITHRGSHPQRRKDRLCLGATVWQLERVSFGCLRHTTASQLNSPVYSNEDGSPDMRKYEDKNSGETREFHARGWKPYQAEIAKAADIHRWVNAGAQLAVVCGAISGGLLIIDFDQPCFFGRWYRRVKQAGLPVECLAIQRTGGGGWQVMVCCENPGENIKLAWVKDESQKSGRSVAIETRGEGGYAILSPSLHPSGNYYRWRRGNLAKVYLWAQDDVNRMRDIARDLNQVMDEAPREYVPRSERRSDIQEGRRVIDAYNEKTRIEDVLSCFGYTTAHGGRWHRPNYERTSEPSVQIKDNRSWHWSSNDELSDGYWKTPFAVRLHYSFQGNLKEAVKTVAAEMGMNYRKRSRALAADMALASVGI